jgi:hypothetical protein
MTNKKIIDVGADFSEKPFGRYPSDGKWNGERFRKEKLQKALEEEPSELEIHLDNIKRGWEYGSSFLEESFGGLVREGIDKVRLLKIITIVTVDEYYAHEIKTYIKNAEPK